MASSSRSTSNNIPAAVRPPRSPESYESLNRRNAAAEILQSYEKLSWYSFSRCESLAQTRLHFQNIVAGFTEEDEAALVDWPEDRTPRVKPGEEDKERSSKKGKERASAGSAQGGEVVAGSSTQKEKDGKGRQKSTSSQGGSAKKKRRSGG